MEHLLTPGVNKYILARDKKGELVVVSKNMNSLTMRISPIQKMQFLK